MGYYAPFFGQKKIPAELLPPGSTCVVVTLLRPHDDHLALMLPEPARVLLLTGDLPATAAGTPTNATTTNAPAPSPMPEVSGLVACFPLGTGTATGLPVPVQAAVADGRAPVIVPDGAKEVPLRLLRSFLGAGARHVIEQRGFVWHRRRLRSVLIREYVRRFAPVVVKAVDSRLCSRPAPAQEGPAAPTAPREASEAIPGPLGRLRASAAARRCKALLQRIIDATTRHQVDEKRWGVHESAHRFAPSPGPGDRLKVALYVGSLNSGGAERQHGNLAIGLRGRGHAVRVLTTNPLCGEDAHYLDLFRSRGIEAVQAGARGTAEAGYRLCAIDSRLVASISPEIRTPVLDLAGELAADPPDVLHCTLDYCNAVGVAAGVLVGVPHIVISMRNVNPTHFAFYRPWMDPWYHFAVTLPRVHMIANSRLGAQDYARWIGIDPSRIAVILNGVDFEGIPEPSPDEIARVRQELGVAPGAPLIAGVFRMSGEKQPLLFLDVIERVAAEIPEVKVALAGVGPLWDEVQQGTLRRGLGGRVLQLGQRKDVPALLSAADVLLLTSMHEGTPNVVLEAQWLRCPPVVTAVGGSPEAVRDGVTGFLHRVDDADGLAASVLRLLRDPGLRRTMGAAGREHIGACFSMDRMVEETLLLYNRAFTSATSGAGLTAGHSLGATS